MTSDLITVYTVLSCGLWTLAFIDFMRALKTVPLLDEDLRTSGTIAEKWPSISIIVPACNEVARIESAISSILTQDYPNLEIIAVNDDSRDQTGSVMERMAQCD